jgi:hypothetical protein
LCAGGRRGWWAVAARGMVPGRSSMSRSTGGCWVRGGVCYGCSECTRSMCAVWRVMAMAMLFWSGSAEEGIGCLCSLGDVRKDVKSIEGTGMGMGMDNGYWERRCRAAPGRQPYGDSFWIVRHGQHDLAADRGCR